MSNIENEKALETAQISLNTSVQGILKASTELVREQAKSSNEAALLTTLVNLEQKTRAAIAACSSILDLRKDQ